ncbi:MAG: hypothetical protein ACR2H1_03945 [Limisphaerales bacterium]
MKKILSILLGGAAVVVLFLLFSPTRTVIHPSTSIISEAAVEKKLTRPQEDSQSRFRYSTQPLSEISPPDLLKEALQHGDLESALQKASRYLEENPEGISIVLSSFKMESDPRLISLLAKLIADHRDASVDRILIEVAQNGDSGDKRRTALGILSNTSPITLEPFQAEKAKPPRDAEERRLKNKGAEARPEPLLLPIR